MAQDGKIVYPQGWCFFQCMNHIGFTNSEVVFLNKWLLKGFVIYSDFAANTFLSSLKKKCFCALIGSLFVALTALSSNK